MHGSRVLTGLLAASILSFVACLDNQSNEPESAAQVPTVLTGPVTATTSSTVECGGTVTADGGAAVTVRGVCWGFQVNPTVTDSRTTDGGGLGAFTSTLTGLTARTGYYIRAYATNRAGTGYGSTGFVITPSSTIAPVLTTATVSAVRQTTAQCGGTVTSDGGSPIFMRGVCWSTGPRPTYFGNTHFTEDGAGTGTFTSSITGLYAGTTYYVRSWAANDDAIGYGDVQSFTTLPDSSGNEVPTVTTAEVSEVTMTTAVCGGTVTSDGGAPLAEWGICWNTSPMPTVADSLASGGAWSEFTLSMSGLVAGTTYYVRAWAASSVGIGYGNERSFTTTSHETGTVTDADGNTYRTIKIGNQWWMAENLRTTRYRNGDPIPTVTDNFTWGHLLTGACCSYDNDSSMVFTYGRLYNWHAVSDGRGLAPLGWHVPSDADWGTLVEYLGGSAVAGGKMKEAGTAHWLSPNTGATNESAFSGCRADRATIRVSSAMWGCTAGTGPPRRVIKTWPRIASWRTGTPAHPSAASSRERARRSGASWTDQSVLSAQNDPSCRRPAGGHDPRRVRSRGQGVVGGVTVIPDVKVEIVATLERLPTEALEGDLETDGPSSLW